MERLGNPGTCNSIVEEGGEGGKQNRQTWMKRLGNPGTCNSIVEEGGTVIMMMIKENYAVNDDDEADDGDKRR